MYALYPSKEDRNFVLALAGQYDLADELKRLHSLPRVRKAEDVKFVDGAPGDGRPHGKANDNIDQHGNLHLEEYPAAAKSQKHAHVQESALYILDGEGYEVHDGIRYDWFAGDIAVAHRDCVHQHCNTSETTPIRALVMTSEPLYRFINLLFQKEIETCVGQAAPGEKRFAERETKAVFEHAKSGNWKMRPNTSRA